MVHRAYLAAAFLGLTLTGCGRSSEVPILLWHSVGEGSASDVYDVPAEEFDAQLALLQSYGVTFITLQQLFDDREGGKKLPEKAVVLTFDDGRQCLYTVARPILEKYGAVAENFLVTSYLGEDPSHRVRVADPGGLQHPYLIWPEVVEMYQAGVMIPESHTRTHPSLRKMSKREQYREISDSRHILRQRLGAPIEFFAYPFGSFSPASREFVEEAGYRGGVSVSRATGTIYDLRRVSIHRGRTELVRATLENAFGKSSVQ